MLLASVLFLCVMFVGVVSSTNMITISKLSPDGPFFVEPVTFTPDSATAVLHDIVTPVDVEFTLNLNTTTPLDKVYFNYVPHDLIFGSQPLNCVGDNNNVVFSWTAADAPALPTRSTWSFPTGIPTNGTKCTVQIDLHQADLYAVLNLGPPTSYLNVPISGLSYGYTAYSSKFDIIERAHVPSFPRLQTPIILKTVNDCFGARFCIINLLLEMAALNNTVLIYSGLGDLFQVDHEYYCRDANGNPILTVTSLSPFGNVISATPLGTSSIVPGQLTQLSLFCSIDLASPSTDTTPSGLRQYSTSRIQGIYEVTRNESNAWSYVQPLMALEKFVTVDTVPCYLEHECALNLRFADSLLSSAPLITLRFTKGQIFSIKTTDTCTLYQLTTNVVYIQLVKLTRTSNSELNSCTLYYTPQLASVHQFKSALTTPSYLHNLHNDLSAELTVNLPSHTVLQIEFNGDVGAYVQSLLTIPQQFKISNYESTPLTSFRIGINPIIDGHYTAVTIPSQCQGVVQCLLTYHVFSPIPIVEIQAENYLKIPDVAWSAGCYDLVGNLIGNIVVSNDLEYLYLRVIQPSGITYTSCTFVAPLLFNKRARLVPHRYIMQRNDIYMNDRALLKPLHDYSRLYSLLVVDEINVPYLSPHSSGPFSWFAAPNSHNNYMTFRVRVSDFDIDPTTTIVVKVTMQNLKGPSVFEFSNVNCFTPNVFNFIIGPSCESKQTASDELSLLFTRQSTTDNVIYAQITFSLGQVAPQVMTGIYSGITYTDPITREVVVDEVTSYMSVPFPTINDLGPLLISREQELFDVDVIPGYDVNENNNNNPTTHNNATTPVIFNSAALKPQDIEQHTIHLFTNHVTEVELHLSNFVQVNSTMIFQLYSKSDFTLGRTPLHWEIENAQELQDEWGLEITPDDETCPFCFGFKVLDANWAPNLDRIRHKNHQFPELAFVEPLGLPLQQVWPGRNFTGMKIKIRYLDTLSSYNTFTQVKMLFKVITPYKNHKWALFQGADLGQQFDITYDNDLSARFITYNYNVQKVQVFHAGFGVDAVIAGEDPLLQGLGGSNNNYRHNTTLSIQLSNGIFTSQQIGPQYPSTIRNVTYTYSFIGCDGWEDSMPSCHKVYDTIPSDDEENQQYIGARRIKFDCGVNTYQTSWYFLPPLNSTEPPDRCIQQTHINVTYFNGNSRVYNFEVPIELPHAVTAKEMMFYRSALNCEQTSLPVFIVGGPGVYTITAPIWDYRISAITKNKDGSLNTNIASTSQYTIVQDNYAEGGRRIVLTVTQSSQSKFTQAINIYAQLSCSENTSSAHSQPWNVVYRSLASTTATTAATSNSAGDMNFNIAVGNIRQITPYRGYYVYKAPSDLKSIPTDVFMALYPNNAIDNEQIHDPINLTPIISQMYIATSWYTTHYFTLAPSESQLAITVPWRAYYRTYSYLTTEYNKTSGTYREVKKIIPMKFTPSPVDPTKQELRFFENIHVYSLLSWKTNILQSPTFIRDRIMGEGLGTILTVSPYQFDGNFIISQCQQTTSRCIPMQTTPLVVLPTLDFTLNFNAEINHYYPSVLKVTRDLVSTDNIKLIFPSHVSLVEYSNATQGAIQGYEVEVKTSDPDYDNKTTVTLRLLKYFIPRYEFSFPTQMTNVNNNFDPTIPFDVEVILDSFALHTGTWKTFQRTIHNVKPSLGVVAQPIAHFNLPRGVRYNENILFQLVLTRDILFGQQFSIGPLPIQYDHKIVSSLNSFEVELTSPPLSDIKHSKLYSWLTVISRTQATITKGQQITFQFPALSIEDALRYRDADISDDVHDIFNVTYNTIYITSPGLGPQRVQLDLFNLLSYADTTTTTTTTTNVTNSNSTFVGRTYELFEPIVPSLLMTRQTTGHEFLMPCKAQQICKLSLELSNGNTNYRLQYLRYFDILLTFNDEYPISSIIPTEWHQQVLITPDGLYKYTYYYYPQQQQIKISFALNLDGVTDMTMIETLLKTAVFDPVNVYIVFIKEQQSQSGIGLDIIKYQTEEEQQLNHQQQQQQRQQYDIDSGVIIYHSTQLVGPVVFDDNAYHPLLFYIQGGVFVEEQLEVGLAPFISLSAMSEQHPLLPKPQTIVYKFQPRLEVDFFDELEWHVQSYDEVIGYPFLTHRQMRSAMQDQTGDGGITTSASYLEATEESLKMILKTDSFMATNELLTLTPNPANPTPLVFPRPFIVRSGFTVQAFAKEFDPREILPSQEPPFLKDYFENAELDGLFVTGKTPQFVIRPKPWVRVIPRVLYPEDADMDIDERAVAPAGHTISVDTLGQIIQFNITFQFTKQIGFDVDTEEPILEPRVAQITDLLTMEIPKFYTVEPNVYTCKCINITECQEVPMIYNGNYFEFHFIHNKTLEFVPTRLQCEFPVYVAESAVNQYMIDKNWSSFQPDLTLSHIDYRFGELTKPLLLDNDIDENDEDVWIPIIPTINLTHNTLPSLTSYDLVPSPYGPDDPTQPTVIPNMMHIYHFICHSQYQHQNM